MDRRNFLSRMSGGATMLAMTHLLGAARGAEDRQDPLPGSTSLPHHTPKAKNCIFIYLVGGASHIDLFDPKPELTRRHGEDAPASLVDDQRFAFAEKNSAKLMGSRFRFQRPTAGGLTFSELLPRLQGVADRFVQIRSMHTYAFNHHPSELLLNTGSANFGRPSLGSWLSYGLGNETQELPAFAVLTAGVASTAGAGSWGSGFLPTNHAGLVLRKRRDPLLNLARPIGVCPTIQSRTIEEVCELARLQEGESAEAAIRNYEQAFALQRSMPEVVDLLGEDARLLSDYGYERPVSNDLRGWEGGSERTFDDFARNCMIARRMVERGVRFVNLYHATWDHHQKLEKNLRLNCEVIDQPIATLIRDLEHRGLLDETLVVVATEFGRTPLGENKLGTTFASGRDHHPRAFSVLMAGGGLKRDFVLGGTDELGWNATESPVDVHDFHATLLHLFGIDHLRLTVRVAGREMRLTDTAGHVIHEILA
ncbi:MAG: DUF1501 domain-containing protein [Pirellulaceae bacterium]